MKNDGTYFQRTGAGKFYPPEITHFKWEGLKFFISPELIGNNPMIAISEVRQSPLTYVVTSKDSGYYVPNSAGSFTIRKAKRSAIQQMTMLGYARVKVAIEKAKEIWKNETFTHP
jgi:hypothetical protein